MPLDTSMFQSLLSHFEAMEIPAKTLLLQEGAISKNAFFIEQGCLRAWFNNEGKDITVQFFFEQEMVTSIESFMSGQPGLFNIESIEPAIIRSIPKADFLELVNSSKPLQDRMQEVLFQRLFFYQKLFLSRIRNNPEQRYKELLENYPDIIRRVPQHYIASYLGITPVSLSRIRNRR